MKNYYLHLSYLLLILLHTTSVSNGIFDKLYIWNVNQGLWITAVTPSECVHFDMGGETAPLRRIEFICARKYNKLVLSHSDLDHIQFILWGKFHLPNLCLAKLPRENLTRKKKKLIESLPLCLSNLSPTYREIEFSIDSQNINDLSRVHEWWGAQNHILMPGDSTEISEKIWARASHKLIRILVLGHHGSRTSTSELLLDHLKNLKLSVSSARKRRYGHPHPLVIERLLQHGVANLRTEQWGNIVLDL